MQNYNLKFKTDLKSRCYFFSLNLINVIDLLPKQRSVWIISDQLLRSGTSVGANLVEASASSSRLEFKKFYEISLKSANETKYWLQLLKDSRKIDINNVNKLLDEIDQLSRMIATGILRLKGKI